MPGLDVKAACGYMTNSGATPYANLAAFNAAAAAQAQQKCIDNSYGDMIASLSNTTVDKSVQGVGMRQWTFQVCGGLGGGARARQFVSCGRATDMHGVWCEQAGAAAAIRGGGMGRGDCARSPGRLPHARILGYYQTCESGTKCPFSYLITLESNFDICWQVFGVSGPENMARIDVSAPPARALARWWA